MKILNLKLLTFLFVSALLFVSCNDNDDANVSELISEQETIALAEADDISDEINNVIDDFLVEDEDLAKTSEIESKTVGILPCVTKTIELTATTKKVTLDFDEGCESPSGNILKGKIIMSYAFNTNALSLTITHTFENFYFNDISVEGGNTIVRVRENENGNPQSIITFGTTLTWPDGVYLSREGTKTREFVEGYNTRVWGDNVFSITGSWTATFKDGTVFSSEIIEPLRREMACRFIVSGSIEIYKGENSGTLNFGDGTCDNVAVFTNENGLETEITLRTRMDR